MSTETDELRADGGAPPAPPTSEQVARGVIDLLREVDEAFDSDKWAILDCGREHVTWLLYDGAALRHCCRLLYEIEVAAAACLELSVRLLGRAHLEAWLVALYVHFGGYEANTTDFRCLGCREVFLSSCSVSVPESVCVMALPG